MAFSDEQAGIPLVEVLQTSMPGLTGTEQHPKAVMISVFFRVPTLRRKCRPSALRARRRRDVPGFSGCLLPPPCRARGAQPATRASKAQSTTPSQWTHRMTSIYIYIYYEKLLSNYKRYMCTCGSIYTYVFLMKGRRPFHPCFSAVPFLHTPKSRRARAHRLQTPPPCPTRSFPTHQRCRSSMSRRW